MNIFEQASRDKLRFKTAKGHLSTEDLWGLSLPSLSRVGKTVKADIRDIDDSMIKTTKKEVNINILKLEVLKYIIEDKQAPKRGITITNVDDKPEEIL